MRPIRMSVVTMKSMTTLNGTSGPYAKCNAQTQTGLQMAQSNATITMVSIMGGYINQLCIS